MRWKERSKSRWIVATERAGAKQKPMDGSDEEVDECSRAAGSTEMQRSDSVATFLTCVSGDPDVADARAMDAVPMPTRVTWDFAVEVVNPEKIDEPRSGGGEQPKIPDHGEFPGNIGFFFGNWGLRQTKDAQSRDVQANVDQQLKCGPAHILGLCEVQEMTADVLRAPGFGNAAVAGDAEDAAHRFQQRDACQYLVVRGQEEASVAIAVRASVADELTVTYWKLRDEGAYKDKKSPDGKRRALTRVLGAEIVLKQPIAFLGNRVNVLCIHLHGMVAKKEKGFSAKYKEFWVYLKKLLRSQQTQVLFGDFNMSLWRVVPELRLLGVQVTLVAWFPWKSSAPGAMYGQPMCDSCGIFVVGQEVTARLRTAVADVHEDDENGFLWRGISPHFAFVEATEDGPGKALDCYLHKNDSLRDRMCETLKYSEGGSKAAVAGGVLRMREKRLEMDVWLGQNKIRMKGAHFPLCVFTHNGRKRSEEATERRKLKHGQKDRHWNERPAVGSQRTWTPQEWQKFYRRTG